MTLRPLVVLALAVLVPVLCMDMKKRCGLRDQLRASLYPRRVSEKNLATVICEVEKFVNQSLMFPTTSPPFNSSAPALNTTSATPPPPAPGSESSSEEDSSEEGSGQDGVDKYLQRCVVVTNSTNLKVDGACLGMSKVFVKIYLNAGEECKKIDPTRFFQDCPKPVPEKSNSDSDESLERPKVKPKSGMKSKPGKKPGH